MKQRHCGTDGTGLVSTQDGVGACEMVALANRLFSSQLDRITPDTPFLVTLTIEQV